MRTIVHREVRKEIYRLRNEGYTLDELAKLYKYTRERIRQILARIECDEKHNCLKLLEDIAMNEMKARECGDDRSAKAHRKDLLLVEGYVKRIFPE